MYEEEYEPMYEEENSCGARYTIMYVGYLFYGDKDGLNVHDVDNWNEVQNLINAYPEDIEVRDNLYDVCWRNGEWF